MTKFLIQNDIQRALNIGIILVLSLGGLFLISKSNADGKSSADLTPPKTMSRTQTEIWAGETGPVVGTLNNLNGPSSKCGTLGQYFAVRSINQDSFFSFTNVTYWEFTSWGDLLIGTIQHTASDWLQNPPSYTLNCWVNEPQVDWKDSK